MPSEAISTSSKLFDALRNKSNNLKRSRSHMATRLSQPPDIRYLAGYKSGRSITTKDVTQLVCSLKTFLSMKPATRLVTESLSSSSLWLPSSASSILVKKINLIFFYLIFFVKYHLYWIFVSGNFCTDQTFSYPFLFRHY